MTTVTDFIIISKMMWMLVVLVALLSVWAQSSKIESLRGSDPARTSRASGRLGKNPEVDMNTTELIRSLGYPVESHDVVTEDGYILGVFRIPHGRHGKQGTGPRPVVLLQHGLIGNCDDFIINSAEQSLGFLLADAGADVWLGNTRGNIHSRRHKTLDPRSLEFWQFNWDDMAQFDLPAMIYHVLNQTGAQQLYYVGHSQGTAIAFARLSTDQALAARVKHFMALAPIARVGNTRSPIRLLLPFTDEIQFFFDTFGHGLFDIPPPILKFLADDLCQKWGQAICENAIFLVCGFDPQSWNASRTDVYVSHGPGGASVMNMLQWAQNIKASQFQHYDYGEKENIAKYGQKTPPLYNPSKVKVPVAIFRGGRDWLADDKDVSWLLPQLNVTHDVYIPRYEHLDLVFAFDAADLIYKDLINIIMNDQ
ncbi:hypothetical protein EGW08_009106 [Elysia chlorotica]|uniref:Lipase n=1 Tax=Elysia chlorotica TaxID=188477 RepID=A0A3S1BGI3_ELYCH|nr:hypothetical protein EGW08_009106 [Elysia chlorotica]